MVLPGHLTEIRGKYALGIALSYHSRLPSIEIQAILVLNAWCELAKFLKRKGEFPDTQTESRLLQRITPLFSTIAFQ